MGGAFDMVPLLENPTAMEKQIFALLRSRESVSLSAFLRRAAAWA